MGEGLYALQGQKWFCSNPTADYWLLIARIDGAPPGGRGVSLFCVPQLWDGKENGHVVQRLKHKLGTRRCRPRRSVSRGRWAGRSVHSIQASGIRWPLFSRAAVSKREDEMLQLWTRVLLRTTAVSGGTQQFLETWEGPYTLLLTRALGELAKDGVRGREEKRVCSRSEEAHTVRPSASASEVIHERILNQLVLLQLVSAEGVSELERLSNELLPAPWRGSAGPRVRHERCEPSG